MKKKLLSDPGRGNRLIVHKTGEVSAPIRSQLSPINGLDGGALSLPPITQAGRVATHPKPPQKSFPQLSKRIDIEARAILCTQARATSSHLMSPLVDTFGKPEHLEEAVLVDLFSEK